MIDTILNESKDRMRKSVEVTINDLSTIRSGRANPALVENIIISAYDGTQNLKLLEMATITASDARTILISPYDPSQIQAIGKGIQEANIGLNPVIESDVIRITIPSLSEERRQEYIKLAKVKIEAGKVMVRQVRHEAMKKIKSALDQKIISEDEEKIGEKKIQEATDQMVVDLDELSRKKETELLQV